IIDIAGRNDAAGLLKCLDDVGKLGVEVLIFFGEFLTLPIGHIASIVRQHSEARERSPCFGDAGTAIPNLKDSVDFVPLSKTHSHFSKNFYSLTIYLHSTLV